jgi:hypothetical protein
MDWRGQSVASLAVPIREPPLQRRTHKRIVVAKHSTRLSVLSEKTYVRLDITTSGKETNRRLKNCEFE